MMNNYKDSHHYLPVDDNAMSWGMYVTGVGHTVMPAGEVYPPDIHPGLYQFDWERGRTLPEFQIILITDGAGEFESGPTGKMAIRPGSLICLFPDVWHRYRPSAETGWTEHWISFNGEIAHRLMDTKMIAPKLAVQHVRARRRLARSFGQFLERVETGSSQDSILLSLHAMGLVALALEMASPVGSKRLKASTRTKPVRKSMMSSALELIWTHSHRPLSVVQISERLGVNRRTLERHFLEAKGNTLLEEIIACRLSRAKRLLVETKLPIKSVSSLSGFSSQERMRVTFIESLGVPPSEYRK